MEHLKNDTCLFESRLTAALGCFAWAEQQGSGGSTYHRVAVLCPISLPYPRLSCSYEGRQGMPSWRKDEPCGYIRAIRNEFLKQYY